MKILLAVDDSHASYEAASTVSEWFPADSSVVALHIGSPVPAATITAPVVTPVGYPSFSLPVVESERRRVYVEAKEVAERAAAVAHGEVRTESGDPATRITEVAAEIDADLIVIGTGDRSWLSRVFTPSVSDEVVHNAPCPVLVVRPADTDEEQS